MFARAPLPSLADGAAMTRRLLISICSWPATWKPFRASSFIFPTIASTRRRGLVLYFVFLLAASRLPVRVPPLALKVDISPFGAYHRRTNLQLCADRSSLFRRLTPAYLELINILSRMQHSIPRPPLPKADSCN